MHSSTVYMWVNTVDEIQIHYAKLFVYKWKSRKIYLCISVCGIFLIF
jgi:hypothetical protein